MLVASQSVEQRQDGMAESRCSKQSAAPNAVEKGEATTATIDVTARQNAAKGEGEELSKLDMMLQEHATVGVGGCRFCSCHHIRRAERGMDTR